MRCPSRAASESRRDAIERALTRGPFAAPDTELTVAYILGVLLIGSPGWQLLAECTASPRAVLFISPSARLARVPGDCWRCRNRDRARRNWYAPAQDAITASGRAAARIPWQLADIGEHTDGYRLMELVDVLMAVPPNIVHSPRTPAGWDARQDGPPLLVLDPRVPGQRPDSALGSVLGRPSAQTQLAQHFAELMQRRPVLPNVDDGGRAVPPPGCRPRWLAKLLAQQPEPAHVCRPREFGRRRPDHASRADRAALHLACTAEIPGDAERHRRPSSAHRVGPDVVAVADATAGSPAGLRDRAVTINSTRRPAWWRR